MARSTQGVRSELRIARACVAALVCALCACEDLQEYATVWRDRSAIAFTEGYTDYQGETDLTDNGVVVFSYAYRSGSEPLIELRNRIVKEHPCYTVIRESATRLVLRCTDSTQTFNGAYEFHFLVDESRRRVFVLRMTDLHSESEEWYGELVGALDRSVKRYRPQNSRRDP